MEGRHVLSAVSRSGDKLVTAVKPDAAAPRPGVELQPLTGLRGVAAVWVALFHYTPSATKFLGWKAPSLVLPVGYLGVDLFFILSGFVIGLRYLEGMGAAPRTTTIEFLINRCFRILPLHWFTLSIMGLFVILWPDQLSSPDRNTENFLRCLFLVQAYGAGSSMVWNWPTWSLSTELAAYVLFPLLALMLPSRLRQAKVALSVAFSSLAFLIAILVCLGRENLGVTGHLSVVRCMLEFVAGLFAFISIQDPGARDVNKANKLFFAGAVVGIIAVFLPAAQFCAPFGFLLIVMASATGSTVARACFGNNIAISLGRISFSVYLIHVPALLLFEAAVRQYSLEHLTLAQRLILVALFWFATLWVAGLAWRRVERPGQRLGKVLSGWLVHPRRYERRVWPRD